LKSARSDLTVARSNGAGSAIDRDEIKIATDNSGCLSLHIRHGLVPKNKPLSGIIFEKTTRFINNSVFHFSAATTNTILQSRSRPL
jgi:hypothetical protein